MKAKIGLIFMVVLLGLPLVVACKPKVAPPVEEAKGTITIGQLENFTGPVGSASVSLRKGAMDAVRYVNERMGGINGHPYEISMLDTKLESQSIMTNWDRLESEGIPVVLSTTLGNFPLLPEMAQKSHIPLIVSSANDMDMVFPTEPCYTFSTFPAPVISYDVVCDLIEKEWAEKGETRTPRVGFNFLGIGNFPQLFAKASSMYAEKRGWEHLGVTTSLTPADVTTQVLQMEQFGADYIFHIATENALIAWIKEVDRQNFHPVMYANTTGGSQNIRDATGNLCDGFRFYLLAPVWTDTDEPLIDLLKELNAEWHPEVTYRGPHYVRGFGHALVLAEALKKAVESVGYGNIDGEAMREALETINDFKPTGSHIGYTWTPTDHQGIHDNRWYQWTEEGMQEPITGWYPYPTLPMDQRSQAFWMQD